MIGIRYIVYDAASRRRTAYDLMVVRVPLAGELVVINAGSVDETTIRVRQVVHRYPEAEEVPHVIAFCAWNEAVDCSVDYVVGPAEPG